MAKETEVKAMNRQEIIEEILHKFFSSKSVRSSQELAEEEKIRFILRHVNDMDLLSIAHGFGLELSQEASGVK